jgi:hypothetical protein
MRRAILAIVALLQPVAAWMLFQDCPAVIMRAMPIVPMAIANSKEADQ